MLNFPQLEEDILKFWQDNDIFNKTLAKDSPSPRLCESEAGKGDFVFYDGPPFATGLPHYGHIVASLMKDMAPRFWTMKGYHVERKWGWDCHGLPIENIVEQELGLKHKKDIEALGVAKFNTACETKVLKYAIEWRKIIERLGRWVDMDNDYKTMDKNFMESVWWTFKQLWDKGLIYEGYRSMHICPRCETTLSQSEVGQGYKDIEDVSITAKFELVDEPGTFVLAWTTTPWTLPGNAALAVGEDIDYVKFKYFNGKYRNQEPQYDLAVVSKDIYKKWENQNPLHELFTLKLFDSTHKMVERTRIVEELKGKKLLGKKYRPLFDYFDNDKLENRANAFKIYAADFISTEEGTGVVHIAPGFGDDDFNLSKKENLPLIKHINMDGTLMAEVTDFARLPAKPKGDHMRTDQKIADWLTAKGLAFSVQKYFHSYPHCWRCDSPLLNYATSSYFVAVEKIKDKLLKQAKKINWMPEHIKEGRFGKWLEGARDWSISRQRYWGSVLPIWICSGCGEKRVFGSVAELEKASDREVNDLHKHVVDKITVPCQKCSQIMRRIPDVLDCWFESGSMPYAQFHYPFENKEKFEKNFPAQFIAEGADQTRAWFYYLHVLAVAIFEKPAFKNVAVNGIVLAEDGKKMSKKLKNYPDPADMFVKYGADAMRYYLATSPALKADDLRFSEHDLATVYKKVLMILGNVLSFYKTYEPQASAPADFSLNKDTHVLDQWILAKLRIMTKEISEAYQHYNLPGASRPLAGFIDELSTWYLRRSRERFKLASHSPASPASRPGGPSQGGRERSGGDDEADKQNALATLRYVLHQLSLLMAPVMPFTAEYLYKEVGSPRFAGLDESRRAGEAGGQKESVHLESWPFVEKAQRRAKLSADSEVLEKMDSVRKIVELALAKRDEAGIKVRQILAKLIVSGAELEEEFSALIKDEVNVKEVVYPPYGDKQKGKQLAVELDATLTDELKEEGLFRELVRTVNQLRKEAGLTINDKVEIHYQTQSEMVKKVIKQFKQELLRNTISSGIVEGKAESGLISKDAEVNGEQLKISLAK